jgi:hypothetical protein
VDYEEIPNEVRFPAGAESVEIIITPIPDKAIEPDKTVEVGIVEPICPAIFPPPPSCYLIGRAQSARVIVQDLLTTAEILQPKVEIVPPRLTEEATNVKTLEIRTDATVQNKGCILETSTDLKTWTAVAPVFLPDGQLSYITEAGEEKQRYYRLRVQ